MNKERLIAFEDAILAIIMTILVLELRKPSQVSPQRLWALRTNFFAYALSFFWLGVMWVSHHNNWQKVKQINMSTIMLTLVLLFFASLFPYTTSLVSENFNNITAQTFYGAIVISLLNVAISVNLGKLNPKANFHLLYTTPNYIVYPDLGLKLAGLLLAITVYPPAMMITIFLASAMLMIGFTQV
ncbi:TMEM175 family protein [Lacticaseibacillus sp. N501-2]|uniref:TMEM175 family protein n=1 Tax=Lacticaseibacillus salsurae TaxID=3367729 RepID=UPI0038B3FA9D